MNDNDFQLERLQQLFHELHQRLTTQKKNIWQLFLSSSRGYTLPEACKALRTQKIGQATIYRMVNLLREHNFLHTIQTEDGKSRYIAAGPQHSHHLVCRSCGISQEVTDCELGVLEKLLSLETGFTIEGHHLEFYGLCPKCRALQESSSLSHCK